MDSDDILWVAILIIVLIFGVIMTCYLCFGPCKHFLQDGTFCSSCGEAIKNVCPDCGMVSALSSNYCRKCGYFYANSCGMSAK